MINRFTFDATGLFRFIESVPTCDGARALAFHPNLDFAYLGCGDGNQLGIFSVAEDGALKSVGAIDNVPFPLGIAVAPNGRTIYVSAAGDDTLRVFRVESNGQLTLLSVVPSGAEIPKAVAVTPDGRFVYVSHGGSTDQIPRDLTGFALGTDGSIQNQVARVTNGINGGEASITPDGRFIYVVAGGSNRVFGYQIGSDGSLTPIPGQPFLTGEAPLGAAVSPDGRWLFVAHFGPARRPPGEVRGWAIGPDGALTEVDRIVTGGDPVSICFSPDSRHLYVNDELEDKVIAFQVSEHGKLKETQIVGAGPAPGFQSVVALPNLGPQASFSTQPGSANSHIRFDASASSDPDGTIHNYVWDFGDGSGTKRGPTPQHVYHRPGNYQVRLTVIDNEGCSTRLLFTGQTPACLGTSAATTTRTVVIN
jgi:6-phosphogluconolactonase (cycloisomerase 2 family)